MQLSIQHRRDFSDTKKVAEHLYLDAYTRCLPWTILVASVVGGIRLKS